MGFLSGLIKTANDTYQSQRKAVNIKKMNAEVKKQAVEELNNQKTEIVQAEESNLEIINQFRDKCLLFVQESGSLLYYNLKSITESSYRYYQELLLRPKAKPEVDDVDQLLEFEQKDTIKTLLRKYIKTEFNKLLLVKHSDKNSNMQADDHTKVINELKELMLSELDSIEESKFNILDKTVDNYFIFFQSFLEKDIILQKCNYSIKLMEDNIEKNNKKIEELLKERELIRKESKQLRMLKNVVTLKGSITTENGEKFLKDPGNSPMQIIYRYNKNQFLKAFAYKNLLVVQEAIWLIYHENIPEELRKKIFNKAAKNKDLIDKKKIIDRLINVVIYIAKDNPSQVLRGFLSDLQENLYNKPEHQSLFKNIMKQVINKVFLDQEFIANSDEDLIKEKFNIFMDFVFLNKKEMFDIARFANKYRKSGLFNLIIQIAADNEKVVEDMPKILSENPDLLVCPTVVSSEQELKDFLSNKAKFVKIFNFERMLAEPDKVMKVVYHGNVPSEVREEIFKAADNADDKCNVIQDIIEKLCYKDDFIKGLSFKERLNIAKLFLQDLEKYYLRETAANIALVFISKMFVNPEILLKTEDQNLVDILKVFYMFAKSKIDIDCFKGFQKKLTDFNYEKPKLQEFIEDKIYDLENGIDNNMIGEQRKSQPISVPPVISDNNNVEVGAPRNSYMQQIIEQRDNGQNARGPKSKSQQRADDSSLVNSWQCIGGHSWVNGSASVNFGSYY